METKIIQVVVFKDVKGLCFMKCPFCDRDIVIRDDEWRKCPDARKREHLKNGKYVYRLNKDNRTKEGFSKVVQAEVKNFAKLYGIKEMEDELNESR